MTCSPERLSAVISKSIQDLMQTTSAVRVILPIIIVIRDNHIQPRPWTWTVDSQQWSGRNVNIIINFRNRQHFWSSTEKDNNWSSTEKDTHTDSRAITSQTAPDPRPWLHTGVISIKLTSNSHIHTWYRAHVWYNNKDTSPKDCKNWSHIKNADIWHY